MLVGVYYIEFYIPGVRTRKEKRSIVNSVKQKIRNRHNVSVSEVSFQDLLQRSAIGIATVNNNRADIDKCFAAIEEQLRSFFQIQVTLQEKEIN